MRCTKQHGARISPRRASRTDVKSLRRLGARNEELAVAEGIFRSAEASFSRHVPRGVDDIFSKLDSDPWEFSKFLL